MGRILFFLSFVLILSSCSKNKREGHAMPPQGQLDVSSLNQISLSSLTNQIDDNPSSHYAYFRRALIYQKTNQDDLALNDINKAISLDPNNSSYTFLKSSILYDQGFLKEALESAEIAATAGLETPLFYTHLAKLYIEIDSIHLAGQYIDEVLTLVPKYDEALRLKGKVEMLQNEFDKSINTFYACLAINNESPETYDYLAKTYLQLGKLDSASYATKLGFKYAKEDNIGLWYNKGKIMERLGKTDTALIIYDKVLKLDPSASYVYNDKATIYMNQGSFTLAVAALEKAIESMPNEKSNYLRAGYCLERLASFNKAQEIYLKAKTKFPGDQEFVESFNRMTYKLERQYRAISI
jgi:tetratricopeptide (TPR) repeat protein